MSKTDPKSNPKDRSAKAKHFLTMVRLLHVITSIKRWAILVCLFLVRNSNTTLVNGFLAGGASSRRNGGSALVAQATSSSDAAVDELLTLLESKTSTSKKSPQERDAITSLLVKLEEAGSQCRYLDDEKFMGSSSKNETTTTGGMLLWDSYELAYFDKSIDGRGRNNNNRTGDDPYKNATRPFGIRSKLLGSLFGLRYSFQHAVRPNLLVNDVGFKVLGLPMSVVAQGAFTRVLDVQEIRNETGTSLRDDTTVCIDFGAPILWFGSKRFPLVFSLGSKAQSPPVTLCTTYQDDKLRLALAAKGGRLVFTRGGKAQDTYANDWETVIQKRPIPGKVLGASLLATVGTVVSLVPVTRIPTGILAAMAAAMAVKVKVSTSSSKKPAGV